MTKFNYSKAYSEFKQNTEKEKIFFLENGMTAENVDIIIEYSKQQFRNDCAYHEHNCSLYQYTEGMEEEGRSHILIMQTRSYMNETKNKADYVSLDWIDSIKNIALKNYLQSLDITNKIILTEIVMNKRPRAELANKLGITERTIYNKYSKIVKEIKKILTK